MGAWLTLHFRGARRLLALLACLGLCVRAGAQRADATQRMVFAHYMLANLDYVSDNSDSETVIASYEREIQQAQQIGIDGFALNAGGWSQEPRYIRRASEMFEAATRLHSGFKLFFSADMCCSNTAADVEDMLRRFANNPRYVDVYYRKDGRALLTTFAGTRFGPRFWANLRSDLERGTNPSRNPAPIALAAAAGVPSSARLPVFFVPAFFFGGELPTAASLRDDMKAYASLLDGAFYWGIAGVPGLGRAPDQLPSSQAYAAALHKAGKLYMAPICFQFWGANHGRYYEYSGYEGMRAMWRDAIEITHPEWVEIVTWNDFVEGTYVSPIDDPAAHPHANDLAASVAPADTLGFFHSHRGAAELLAYFIRWYKTGRQPTLAADTVYWAYRKQPIHAAPSASTFRLYGPVADVIYITANLTAAADLRVTTGAQATTLHLAAGSSDVRVPLVAGPPPSFNLSRGGQTLTAATADDAIEARPALPDFYYSTGFMHD